ncbi:hypothetical protein Tco_1050428, partial [Tanacetum coccineum]
ALFVFSVYRSSSISLSSSPPIAHFQLPIQKSPTLENSPKFSFTIKKVNLHIYVDHFKVLDQTGEDLDKKLNESRMILDFAQWLEAWWPSSDDEFAFVVEDDIELSPLYYRFLKGWIVEYYYNASNYSPWVYGASLQRPRFVPALSVSHTDAGVNYGKTAGPDPNLIQEKVLPDKVVNSVNELEPVLKSAQKANALVLEIAVKAYVTKKALEMKYDTWVLDHGMIPVKAEFFLNWVKLESAVDFYIGERLGLLFAKSSGSGIWTNHFVNEIADMPESNLSNDEDGFGFLAGKDIGEEGC